ncbi:MAG: acyl-CoA dehydrogenase family protein [Caulobacteraceae bacterium]
MKTATHANYSSSSPQPGFDYSLTAEVLEQARAAAPDVDLAGRFPTEAFAGLRAHGLLSVLVPTSSGGPGLSLREAAIHCQSLAAACGSAGMVLAMHHIQVASIVRHAPGAPWHSQFLKRMHDQQLLLASSTSEVGTGGSLRTSVCSIETSGSRFSVEKQATAISYGADADVILVTTRAEPSAPPSDQVLTVLERSAFELQKTASWDAMGMRGTGSEGYLLKAEGDVAQTIPAPFAEIADVTMVPVSHILWASVWTGIAGDAVMRARDALKKRHTKDLSSDVLRLGQAVELLQMAEARVQISIDRFDWSNPQPSSFARAASSNALKASVSEACLTVAQQAMSICGFPGYARDGAASVARHVRDLHSAPLMISNGRMRDAAAHLLLAQRPELGLK